MKFTFKDLTVGILVILGIAGSINWITIPYYIYIFILIAYAGLRLANKDENEVK